MHGNLYWQTIKSIADHATLCWNCGEKISTFLFPFSKKNESACYEKKCRLHIWDEIGWHGSNRLKDLINPRLIARSWTSNLRDITHKCQFLEQIDCQHKFSWWLGSQPASYPTLLSWEDGDPNWSNVRSSERTAEKTPPDLIRRKYISPPFWLLWIWLTQFGVSTSGKTNRNEFRKNTYIVPKNIFI